MNKEQRTIRFIQSLDFHEGDLEALSRALRAGNYLHSSGSAYTKDQLISLLHSANQAEQEQALLAKKRHQPKERCGIDREANPCGDASDY